MSRSLLQKRIASALLLTTVAIQLHASGAWSALQSTPVFEPLIGVSNAEAQSSGFFAQNAAPKYGNTWLSSITCRQSNGTNVVRGMESGTGHPDLMWQAVRDAIQSRGLSITPPSVPILRSTGATGAGFEWDDNSGTENIQTLQAVCQIFGYESYVSSTCRDWIHEGAYPNGRCNFHSPENNQLSSFSGTVSQSQCQDGIDNDNDGLTDFPSDPGCTSANDTDETNAVQCPIQTSTITSGNPFGPLRNLVNNSGQGFIPSTAALHYDAQTALKLCQLAGYNHVVSYDCTAPAYGSRCGYASFGDNQMYAWNGNSFSSINDNKWIATLVCSTAAPGQCNQSQCQDGIDNDNDGATDFPGDFSCSSATDNDETNPRAACQDGIDNDQDGQTDFPQDIGCTSRQDNDEFNAIQCTATRVTTSFEGKQGPWEDVAPSGDAKAPTFISNVQAGGTMKLVSVSGTYSARIYGGQDQLPLSCDNGTVSFTNNSNQTLQKVKLNTFGSAGITVPNGATRAYLSHDEPGSFNYFDNSGNRDHRTPCQVTLDVTPNSCQQPQCADGIDNDGDGLVDFPQDPGCFNSSDNDESPRNIANLDVEKTIQGSIVPGQNVTYVITVRNTGSVNAQNVNVFDYFLDQNDEKFVPFTFVSSTGVTCSYQSGPQQISCPINAIAPGNTVTIGLTFNVPQIQACNTQIRNRAEAWLSGQQLGADVDDVVSNVQCINQCQDGIDNDQDGATDFPADFSCSSPTDTDETNPKSACQDGFDNDFDNLVDFPLDTGCTSAQDNDEFNAPQMIDLSIQKTTNQPVIVRGNTLVYTITVSNAQGAAQANNVIVTDNVPTGLTFNDAQSYVPCSVSGNQVTCPIGTLPAGASGSFQLAFDVPTIQNCTTSLSITNTAVITALPQQDSNNVNNTASQVPAQTRADCPQSNQCQDGIDNDQDGATDFPQDFSCSSPTDTDETNPKSACQDGFDNDFDNLVDFPLDTGCTSAQDNDEFNAPQMIDLSIQKTTNQPVIVRGNTLVYTITVSNAQGAAQANNVIVTDNVPTGLTFNDAQSYVPCSVSGNQVTCPIGTLPAGASGSFQLAFDVPTIQNCTTSLSITNTAVITALPQQDSNNVNNTASQVPAQTRADCPQSNQCQDGIDNDQDGATDFPQDFSCSSPTDTDETNPKSACQDGFDNDFDGKIDFPLDTGCTSAQDNDEFNAPLPACQDGIDNDGDGRTDLQDPGCSGPTDTNEGDEAACQDLRDNDGDNLIDFPFDPGCANPLDTDEFNQIQTVDVQIQKSGPTSIVRGNTLVYTIQVGNSGTAAATNVVVTDTVPAGLTFNDNASYLPCSVSNNVVTCPIGTLPAGIFGSFTIGFDVPTIQNCTQNQTPPIVNSASITSTEDTATTGNNVSSTANAPTRVDCPATTQCSDFNDNDFDGRIDFPADPGCSSPQDNDEFNAPLTQCSDGIDNDFDGRTDLQDPGCSGPNDTNEGDEAACQDLRDNDFDGLTDFPADPGCTGPTDTDESNVPQTQCNDNIDNDGDGRIDSNDAGCSGGNDNNEGDGAADLSISLTGPATIQGGGTAQYVVTVANNGPDAATTPFSLRVSVPTGVTFNAGLSSQGCTQQGAFVVCSGITLGLFQQTTRNVVFNIPASGFGSATFESLINLALGIETAQAQAVGGICNTTIVVNANVVPVQPDPNQGNNNAQAVNTFVSCQAAAQCSDGVDNDFDGRVDFPLDPGCANAQDNNEGDDPIQTGCIEIMKETYDPHGNRLPVDAQFTFILDATRVTYNGANGRARFDNVTPGQHGVAEIIPSGWTQLSVSPQNGVVNVTASVNCAQVTFRNRQVFVSNAQCADGYDNDGDGLTDFPADTGCTSATDNDEYNSTFVPQCRDGVDNDGDNLVDFPNDLGCVNADDNNEQNQTVQAVACADGVDNDGDGLVDLLDPGCANAADTSEANTVVPQLVACNDGIDNDQDGTIDFPLDTGCQSATDTDEFNFRAPRCNDGIDNDGDGATDFPLDPGCNTPFDDNEWNNRFWADRWREFWNWNW